MQRGGGIRTVIGKMGAKILEKENKLNASLPNMAVVVAEFMDGVEA